MREAIFLLKFPAFLSMLAFKFCPSISVRNHWYLSRQAQVCRFLAKYAATSILLSLFHPSAAPWV